MIEKIEIEILNTGHITNSYLVWAENKEAVLVDPADKSSLIEQKIQELGLNLKYILLTHAHADHVLATNDIIQKYNVKVIANINEKDMLDSKISNSSNVFGIEQTKFNLDNFIFLKDKESVSIGDTNITMIHTPGHTKGSASYYISSDNILLTGDTLFSNCFGRCDLETGNIEDMIKSLIRLYKNYKNILIYPGHEKSPVKIEETYEKVRRYLMYSMAIDINDMIN